ncbi:MAG: PHP domain-containing protein [Patescibacteria group bacterium]|mgnify:FL=1
MLVDLHLHSTFSDGRMPVPELVAKAKLRGIGLLALCDHDTIEGAGLFKKICRQNKIQGVTGVEMSTSHQNNDFHILALNPRHHLLLLKKFLKLEQDKRQSRARQIIKNFEGAGFFFSATTKNKLFGQPSVGKPQLARAIMAVEQNKKLLKKLFNFEGRNLSRFIKTFFEKPGALGHVLKPKPESVDVIHLIKKTGAKSVLAHPDLDFPNEKSATEIITHFKKEGLWGLELPHIMISQRPFFRRLARQLGLVLTYGSDSHNGRHLGIKISAQEYKKLFKSLT